MIRCLKYPVHAQYNGCPWPVTHIMLGPRPTACVPLCARHAKEAMQAGGSELVQVTWSAAVANAEGAA